MKLFGNTNDKDEIEVVKEEVNTFDVQMDENGNISVPVEESDLPTEPKKRGRKSAKAEDDTNAEPPKKRGRKSKAQIEADRAAAEEKAIAEMENSAINFANGVMSDAEKIGKISKKSNVTDSIKEFAEGIFKNKGNPDVQIQLRRCIEIMLIQPSLGVSSSNKTLYADYIASKAPDAASKEEEIEAIGEEGYFEKGTTIFHRWPAVWDKVHNMWRALKPGIVEKVSGKVLYIKDKFKHKFGEDARVEMRPCVYDYQLRGMLKENFSFMGRSSKGEGGNNNLKYVILSAFKKSVDGQIFIKERHICPTIPEYYYDDDGITRINTFTDDGKLQTMQRSLRTSGPTGERVAIASSEMIPAGSTFKFTIELTDKRLWEPVVSALNYGYYHGFSGWRNSGLGIFRWRVLDDDLMPIPDLPNDGWNIPIEEEDSYLFYSISY